MCSKTCGTYHLSIRPELLRAYAKMSAKTDFFTYAICRTYDGQAWEVETKNGNIYNGTGYAYTEYAEAMTAGVAWLLEQQKRQPGANLKGNS